MSCGFARSDPFRKYNYSDLANQYIRRETLTVGDNGVMLALGGHKSDNALCNGQLTCAVVPPTAVIVYSENRIPSMLANDE